MKTVLAVVKHKTTFQYHIHNNIFDSVFFSAQIKLLIRILFSIKSSNTVKIYNWAETMHFLKQSMN